jgi:hypothetical protein
MDQRESPRSGDPNRVRLPSGSVCDPSRLPVEVLRTNDLDARAWPLARDCIGIIDVHVIEPAIGAASPSA